MAELENHAWPLPSEHLWDEWTTKTGLPKPTQSRRCIHPHCTAHETREAPRA